MGAEAETKPMSACGQVQQHFSLTSSVTSVGSGSSGSPGSGGGKSGSPGVGGASGLPGSSGGKSGGGGKVGSGIGGPGGIEFGEFIEIRCIEGTTQAASILIFCTWIALRGAFKVPATRLCSLHICEHHSDRRQVCAVVESVARSDCERGVFETQV